MFMCRGWLLKGTVIFKAYVYLNSRKEITGFDICVLFEWLKSTCLFTFLISASTHQLIYLNLAKKVLNLKKMFKIIFLTIGNCTSIKLQNLFLGLFSIFF